MAQNLANHHRDFVTRLASANREDVVRIPLVVRVSQIQVAVPELGVTVEVADLAVTVRVDPRGALLYRLPSISLPFDYSKMAVFDLGSDPPIAGTKYCYC